MVYIMSCLNIVWVVILFCCNLCCDFRIVWFGGLEFDNIFILNVKMIKINLNLVLKLWFKKENLKSYLIMKDGWLINYYLYFIFRDYDILVVNNFNYNI